MGAGEDEIVDPPSLADWWKRQSMILGLWMRDGLIERRCRRDESGPYYLTAKARAYLTPPNYVVTGLRPLGACDTTNPAGRKSG